MKIVETIAAVAMTVTIYTILMNYTPMPEVVDRLASTLAGEDEVVEEVIPPEPPPFYLKKIDFLMDETTELNLELSAISRKVVELEVKQVVQLRHISELEARILLLEK